MERVLVWGLAKSGVSAARLLSDAGIFVRINDMKTQDVLSEELKQLEGCKYENRLGEDVMTLLDDVDTIVISPGIPADHKAANEARRRGIEVISEIELAYRFSKGLLIGITGTNGKTTTTTLIGEIFKSWGKQTFVVGNIGEPYSAHALETNDDSVTVCELSSFQLETVKDFKPHISLVLNLTEDHLNRHGTIENYAHIKENIFMNQRAGDFAIFNHDDSFCRDMASRANCDKRFFSVKQKADGAYCLDDGIVYIADRALINANEIRIPGRHNLENALAASLAASCAGVPDEIIAETLRTFAGVEHRIETVRTVDGITFINDSKGTNPDSTIKAVECMAKPTVIMLGGSVKNSDYDEMSRIIAGSNVKFAVLLGDTGETIGLSLDRAGFSTHEYVGHDFEKAILCAKAHAEAGWNVLLSPACASFDMFKDFEERGEVFKRIVNSL